MAEHRAFELRHVVREVPGLGLCDVRAPSGATERVLSQYYADEHADPTAFVDAFLSHTVIAPRLSYDAARTLSSEAREGLRAAAADAAGLSLVHGAVSRPAASDEALLAAMRERWKQLAGAASPLDPGALMFVPAQRFMEAVADIRERVHAALRGQDIAAILERLLERMQVAGEYAEFVLAYLKTQPLGFVILDMRAADGFELLLESEQRGRQVVADAVEKALVSDAGFLARVREAVENSSSLDQVAKDELAEAVDALAAGKPWPVPCRLLLGGLEGQLWYAAKQEGVIDSSRGLVKTARPGRPQLRQAQGVNQLLDGDVGFDRLEDELRLFLDDALWDGYGQDLRHGRARERHREYACWGLVALCGWLDRTDGTRLMSSVGDLFDATLAPVPA